jgi:chromosome partitioning protein
MANVISVLNPKGGTGKTTLSVHLARALRLQGEKVLLVDSDQQGSARDWNEAGEGKGDFPVVGLDRPTLDKDVPSLAEFYSWVIIDGAAKLEKMSANAVKAADLVLIPVQPSPLDIWACDTLVEMIQARQQVTDGIPAAAFVVSRAKKGTVLAREVSEAIAGYELPILNGAIHDRTVFARAMTDGSTALDDEPEGTASWEINHLLNQLVEAFK